MTRKLMMTARGSVSFPKDVLQHLGINRGEAVELDLLPYGRVMLKAARPLGSIDAFIGMLAGKTKKTLTIEEMNEIAAAGWAGKRS